MSATVGDIRIREVIAACGGMDAILDTARQFKANQDYLEQHRAEFKMLHPDQWVGIVRQQVTAVDGTADGVLATLRAAGENTGVAVLHHACVEEPVWLLAAVSR